MPSIDLAPETFAKLLAMSARTGRSPQSELTHLVEIASRTAEEREREWNAVLGRIRAGVPEGVTEEETEADVAAALAEVRARGR